MAVPSKSVTQDTLSSPAARFLGGVFSIRRRIATTAAGGLALALGYHVVFGHNGLLGYQQKRTDTRTLDLELRALTDENDRLRGHVDRLQTDPNAIEQQARSGMGYTRTGEIVVMMSEAPAKK